MLYTKLGKRVLALALILLMVAAIAGCQPVAAPPAPTTQGQDAPEPTEPAAEAPADTSAPEIEIPQDQLAYESAQIDWQQFAGTNLRIMYCGHPYQDAVAPLIPEFESLTGMKVSLEVLPETEFFNKLLVEYSGGLDVPDVIMLNVARVATYDAGGWIEDLTPFINNPKLTDKAWYDPEDFYGSGMESGALGSKQYGLPITGEWQIVFYRKDLYESMGLSAPKTMDDLYNNAVAIKSPEIAGIANRLARAGTAWWPWAGYVGSYNSYWINPETQTPQLTTPEVVAATEMYVKQLKDAGPDGAVNYDWNESLTDFQQGRSGHFVDSSVFMAEFEDPEKSVVAGKVGYAPMPIGPSSSDQGININYWLQGMSAGSKNKEAAWLFLQWATSKKVALQVAIAKGTSARASIWEHEDFLATIPADFAVACAQGARKGVRLLIPEVKELGEISEFVNIALNSIYMGDMTVEAALEEAQAKTLSVLGK